MKYLLLIPIQLYWKLIPPAKRRTCVFQESCSRYVYRHADTAGLIAGLIALKCRIQQCRPGNRIFQTDNQYWLISNNGKVWKVENLKLTDHAYQSEPKLL